MIKGATVHASDTLLARVGGNLAVESVQDKTDESSYSVDVGNRGANISRSGLEERKTVKTTLTGKNVVVDVAKEAKNCWCCGCFWRV